MGAKLQTTNTHLVRGRYSEEEIERGLHAIAICAGNTRRAQRELKVRGVTVPRTTLESWKQNKAERYQAIRAEIMPAVHARMAQESEDLAGRYADLEHQAIDDLAAKLSELKPAEAAGAVRNLATSRGISTDKALTLRGQPNHIIKHDVQADIRALVASGIAEYVDSDAEEAAIE